MNLKNLVAKLLSFRRFSLRTFLLLVLLAGCGLGVSTTWYRDLRDRGEAQLRLVARTNNPNASLSIGYFAEPAPSWFTKPVRAWVHPEYRRSFKSVHLGGAMEWQLEVAQDFAKSNGVQSVMIDEPNLTPEFAGVFFRAKGIQRLRYRKILLTCDEATPVFRALTQATELEELSLDDGYLCDAAASEIAKLPNLKRLRIDACNPESLPHLANCPSLESLHLKRLRSSDEFILQKGESEAKYQERSRPLAQKMFDTFADRPMLTSLHIEGTLGVTAEDLKAFAGRSRIQFLSLHSSQMSPDALAEIAKCPQLKALQIYDFAIGDEHLPLLKNAKGLKIITLGPNISWKAIRELRQHLPTCKIDKF